MFFEIFLKIKFKLYNDKEYDIKNDKSSYIYN